jgi:hypothetical protein
MNGVEFVVNDRKGKAPPKPAQSKGFACSNTSRPARQRLDCAAFSGALAPGRLQWLLAMVFAGLLVQANQVWACAACYGQSDSPLAKGMNWGIFSLLGVVVFVLGSVASFFVYIGKRGAKTPPGSVPAASADPIQKGRP